MSPTPGTQQRFEIEADYDGIVEGLENNVEFSWPTEPQDERESRRREMINFCLALDPMGRPGDMREVARYFETVETDLAVEDENQKLIEEKEKTEKKRRGTARKFTMASLVALGLGGGLAFTQWKRTSESEKAKEAFARYRDSSESTMADLKAKRAAANSSEKIALEERAGLQRALAAEQSNAVEELATALKTSEVLFDWSLEEGVEGLPSLEGRRTRLGLLAKEVEAQLAGLKNRPDLKQQAALLQVRQAEISLAMGNATDGERELAKALEQGGLSDSLTARARLRLLLLKSKNEPAKLETMITEVEEIIPTAWPDDVSRTLRAEGALDLAKARFWEAKNEGPKALKAYQASLTHFKELEKRHPNAHTVSLMVGRRYLSAATAAEGEGSLDNSAKLRAEAAKAFTALAERQKNPSPELQYQIASATAARAISMWQRGDTFSAEKLARQGVAKLSGLLTKMPGDFRVIVDLVSQQGIIATALRDEGSPGEAKTLLNQGIKSLTEGIEKHPRNWGARYLLASLKWQLSGLMGQAGESESELKMGEAAREELMVLLNSGMMRPHPSEVRKSLAYLCGDLGHSADLKNEKDLAVKYLKESQRYWQELARDEGDQLEIRQGYHWAATRLAEMGVK